ncbi:hypothetical protein MA16_Dca015012 [Dendrobium catenatum]|uniref:Uncharacterized protein n=1 Tax=Dendrobium catenatum TaxID=906689 RepID=A0A2I0VDW1_9ASPA|nr:hypothetical protein MA16_Dca015012 [Dendrobium catenatum]
MPKRTEHQNHPFRQKLLQNKPRNNQQLDLERNILNQLNEHIRTDVGKSPSSEAPKSKKNIIPQANQITNIKESKNNEKKQEPAPPKQSPKEQLRQKGNKEK